MSDLGISRACMEEPLQWTTLHELSGELYGHNGPGRRRIQMASLLTANSRRSARACTVTSRSSPVTSRSRLFRFVLERQLDLGPVEQFPSVTDDDVHLSHLGHSDITHRSTCCGDRLCRRL